jgi:hypothetical protein
MTIRDHCTQFLARLQEKHPVPCTVTLEFPAKVHVVKGRVKPPEDDIALVTMNKVDGYALISLYPKAMTSLTNMLKALAHEYKHILQYFVENPGDTTAGFWNDPGAELDAEIFGILMARLYCEKYGLAL